MMRPRSDWAYGSPMPPPPLTSLIPPHQLRQTIAILATIILFGMLVIGTRPLDIRAADPGSAMGNSSRQIWYFAMFGMLVIGSQFYNRLDRLLALPISVAALLGWCALTLAWSDFPEIGARRLMLTALLMWSIFRICAELGYPKSMALLRVLLAASLALNYAAVALSPAAVHQFGEPIDPALVGCWRGFLFHKNFTGALCAVTVLAFVFGGRHWHFTLRALVIVAACYFLYRTGSKTSFAILFVALAAGWVYLFYSPIYRALLIPAVMIFGSLGAYYVTDRWASLIAPLYSPDVSILTGRLVIWRVSVDFWFDHPWGAGYGSFWNVGLDGAIFRYASNWVANVGNGHNGYLDLLITIGPVGLVLALLALVVLPVASILSSLTIPRGAGAWAIAVIAFAVGHNMTESTLLDRDAVLQVSLMFALAQVAALTRRPIGFGRITQRIRTKRLTKAMGTGAGQAVTMSGDGVS